MELDDLLSDEESKKVDDHLGLYGTSKEERESISQRIERCRARGHRNSDEEQYPEKIVIPYRGGGLNEEVLVLCRGCGGYKNRPPTISEMSEYNRGIREIMSFELG
jgi:hypothetical protein